MASGIRHVPCVHVVIQHIFQLMGIDILTWCMSNFGGVMQINKIRLNIMTHIMDKSTDSNVLV